MKTRTRICHKYVQVRNTGEFRIDMIVTKLYTSLTRCLHNLRTTLQFVHDFRRLDSIFTVLVLYFTKLQITGMLQVPSLKRYVCSGKI